MKQWYAGMAVAVLFVVLAVTVYAGPGGMGRGMGSGMMGPGGYAYLNLSQDQMDKMWQLKDKYYNDTRATRYQMFQKQVELRKLYADPKADAGVIAAKEKEVSSLRQQLYDKMAQMRLEQEELPDPGADPETQRGAVRLWTRPQRLRPDVADDNRRGGYSPAPDSFFERSFCLTFHRRQSVSWPFVCLRIDLIPVFCRFDL